MIELPKLTQENYYEPEVRNKYMTIHTYMQYAGTLGKPGCEARAEAIRKGEWVEEKTKAMLVGSYVDAFFDNSLNQFKEDNPEIFTKQGELKADYRLANTMIERCVKDELFMKYMSGEKQVIMTADMFDTTWCCKLDSYIPDVAIVDLKTTADLHRSWRVQDAGYVSVVEFFGYHLQLAAYQEIVRINTGKKLPCYLAFVTKEQSPEVCVVYLDQNMLDHALNEIRMNMPQINAIRRGEMKPIMCGCCDFCKATKKLEKVISVYDLISE